MQHEVFFICAFKCINDLFVIAGAERFMEKLRERKEGDGSSVASVLIETTMETRGAALYGALIVLLAVMPIFFMGGVSGAFFTPLAAAYALAAITAAVVGVMLNLSIWFALHVYFRTVEAKPVGPLTVWTPSLASFDWRVLLLSVVCAVLLLTIKWSVVRVLCLSALGGLALSYITS